MLYPLTNSHSFSLAFLQSRQTQTPTNNKILAIMPSGTNSQGNNYNTPGGTNSSGGSSYHYSNNNGSYYYANDNGSTYYNSGSGSSTYTSPSGQSSSSSTDK